MRQIELLRSKIKNLFATQTLQARLLTAFVFLLLIPTMIILIYLYSSTKLTVLDLSNHLIVQVTGKVTNQTINFLEPAAIVAQLGAQFPDVTDNNLTNNQEIEQFGIKVLEIYPQLSGFFVANLDGDFLFTKRFPGEGIGTKRIERTGEDIVASWSYRNEQGEITTVESLPEENYDPRIRPWFVGAMEEKGIFWTDIYIFFTAQQPGITASYPIFNSENEIIGIVGVDVALAELSSFLEEQTVGQSGVVFLLTEKGEIVAFPNAPLSVADEENKLRLIKIEELDDPSLASGYQKYLTNNEDYDVVEGKDGSYISSFTPFPEDFGKDWLVAVVVPEKDFLVGINRALRLTWLIAIAVFIAALLVASRVATAISNPIVALTEVAQAQARGRTDLKASIVGPQETQALAKAFNRMSDQLQDQIGVLNEEVGRRTHLLQATLQVSRTANSLLNLSEITDQVLSFLVEQFDLYHVAIFVLDGNELYQVSAAGEQSAYFIDHEAYLPVDNQSMVGLAGLSREPQVSNDVLRTKHYRQHPLLVKTRAEATFPMIVKNELIGVVDFQTADQELFDTRMVDALESITHQIAIALSNAQAFERIKETANQLLDAKDVAEKAQKEAEIAAQAKAQFLASMSHELRTPLNAILGLSELLLGTRIDVEQKDFLETMHQSGNVLLALINDVLDFSKIDAGKMEIERVPFSLQQVVEESIAVVGTIAEEKGLSISVHISPKTPKGIVGDITRLRQIIVNLLNNGVKFTEDGEISLSIESEYESERDRYLIQFAIKDSGIGIPADQIEHLFSSFRQVDVSTTRKYGGTGLGLAISKNLAEAMGGKMWVESAGIVGQGTTFYFTISAPDATHLIKKENKAVAMKDGIDRLLSKKKPLSILLVDDNVVNRKVAIHILKRMGYEVTIAVNGIEAAEKGKTGLYNLILMDIQMPEMDGVEATRLIREADIEAGQPHIIAMTANAMKGDRERFLSAGMDNYISKPVRIETLAKALQMVPVDQIQSVDMVDTEEETEEADQAEVLDAAQWLVLIDTMGDFLPELIQIYLEDTPELLQEIDRGVQEKELELIQRAGHTMKGNSSTLVAFRLAQLAFQLEEATADTEWDDIKKIGIAVHEEYARVVEALTEKLKGLS